MYFMSFDINKLKPYLTNDVLSSWKVRVPSCTSCPVRNSYHFPSKPQQTQYYQL